MMRLAQHEFGEQIGLAWQDFHLTDIPVPYDPSSYEQQIFMPYFLFHWDPQRPRTGKRANRKGGIVTRWYELERSGRLSDIDRLFLEQATTQPVSFYEVLWSEAGQRIGLRDILVGAETEVIERSASRALQTGDIVYGQVWKLEAISILGCLAPIRIPPSWKGEVIALRKKLRRKIAKQNRDLIADDLVRHADAIRLTYLTIRDGLNTPPQLANTDGDPLVFHTLKFRIESPEGAFERLAPLALGQAKEELLEGAEFGKDGKLHGVELDWRKKGNAKIPSWDNTILGRIRISGRSLVAEVNSENRAQRLRAEIDKRLGASAVHLGTTAQTAEEMLIKAPRRATAQAKREDQFVEALLRDPEARSRFQEMVQKQVENWVHQKIPALGGRTPLQAVRDPDGREIVESLLLDWERRADEDAYQAGIRPDLNAVRKLLNITSASS
jgi:Antitoxin Xre/MbcA/ParS C-terminal toxin-binding domain